MKYDSIQMMLLKLITVLTVVGLSVFVAQRNARNAADSSRKSANCKRGHEFDLASFAEPADRDSRRRIQVLLPVRVMFDVQEGHSDFEADDGVAEDLQYGSVEI